MKMHSIAAAAGAVALTGCSTANLPDRLGTMKNPRDVLEHQFTADRDLPAVQPFIVANYSVLLNATEGTGAKRKFITAEVEAAPMREYLNAGFALSDIYCEEFFQDAEESQRRRQYGRAITNDVGTTLTAILGLANAGQDWVTATSSLFGLGDSLWRNYDEAFVVSPDLSNVRALVFAAKDVLRKESLVDDDDKLPKYYSSAQILILRYAKICSTLGMQGLLNQSANQQRLELLDRANPAETGAEDEGDAQPRDGGGRSEAAGEERMEVRPAQAAQPAPPT